MNIQRPKSKQPIPDNAKRVFKGVIFDVYQWEQEMYDGTKATFEKIKRRDSIVVFPVLPDGKIILSEQVQPRCEPFWDTTAGRVDEGEDIIFAAKRELLEESGYEAQELILWFAQQPVKKIDWVIYTFIAKGLKKVADVNPDAGEKIKLFNVSLDELIDRATNKHQTFNQPELVSKFFEGKLDPKKMEELRELFKP